MKEDKYCSRCKHSTKGVLNTLGCKKFTNLMGSPKDTYWVRHRGGACGIEAVGYEQKELSFFQRLRKPKKLNL